MYHQTVRALLTVIPFVVLGLSAMFMPTHCAAVGLTDPPATTGSTGDGDRSGRVGEKAPQSGLDNTPSGGTLQGGTLPGGTIPGGTPHGDSVPGGTYWMGRSLAVLYQVGWCRVEPRRAVRCLTAQSRVRSYRVKMGKSSTSLFNIHSEQGHG